MLKMPSNSLPDADLNLPEMKTKSPSCPAGGVHLYESDQGLHRSRLEYTFFDIPFASFGHIAVWQNLIVQILG